MAGKYKIEYGPKDDRKVKLGLRVADVMAAYEGLAQAGEIDLTIVSPQGKKLDPRQFRLDSRSVWGS